MEARKSGKPQNLTHTDITSLLPVLGPNQYNLLTLSEKDLKLWSQFLGLGYFRKRPSIYIWADWILKDNGVREALQERGYISILNSTDESKLKEILQKHLYLVETLVINLNRWNKVTEFHTREVCTIATALMLVRVLEVDDKN
ncbi:hypothetical protein HK099_006519 [Clydaea vesicula]|uniref:Uncharacterized protein n=1 Tax=Clydaea vesicula TaxID=447962 RepID=A0AAD5U131_9FUNG|nr:hypothetical protein HK099_006519 [Clydaea vesicula]